MKSLLPFLIISLAGCPINPAPTPSVGHPTSLTVQNLTDKPTTVYVAFGSDSVIVPGSWSWCTKSGKLTCSFPLGAFDSRVMDNKDGGYLNATLSFANPVGCGVTKAEVNINNPNWYDILDVSLVDGFSNRVSIVAESMVGTEDESVTLGPATDGPTDADLLGVYPFGCDICVERQSPPCGIAKGKTGCKAGTQYDPTPPCQWQGASKGGGDLSVLVKLVE